jgi:hypothetical protein
MRTHISSMRRHIKEQSRIMVSERMISKGKIR